jgi:flagellar hook-associated protein 2
MSGMQITGLMSNLDTGQIIDALLTYDKANVSLIEDQQTTKTNQITAYQAINAKLLAFQTQAKVLSSSKSFLASSVTSSDEDYVRAIAGDDVALGNYSINVEALAQNHQVASQGFSELEAASLGSGTVRLWLGDGSATTITLDSGDNSLEALKKAINSANIDIKASIVDDGTDNNPYRLLLTSTKSGAKNAIHFEANLSGPKAPDFTTASFDDVELLSYSSQASSLPSLGASASYTGNENKTYTFTVAGGGTHTVGDGDITINWTDGTNSGSFVVSGADTEVALTGEGSDGLTLQFDAGDLEGGDTFQVQTFAPLLQKAQDARVTLGSTSGGGSPISITSDTNLVTGLISGVTLQLKQVTDGNPIVISASEDTSQVEDQINSFISKFNDVISAIDDQFTYDPDNGQDAGILFGDSTLMMIQTSLRSRVTSSVDGLSSDYRMLADIGIRVGSTGALSVVDRDRLEVALRDNMGAVLKLFTTSGDSSNSKITFLSAGNDTVGNADGYDVQITQAAEHGYLRGGLISDPTVTSIVIDSHNSHLKFTVDGMSSQDIVLTEGTYNNFDDLKEELQAKINADPNIGGLGVDVEYIDSGDEGFFRLTSGSYGSGSIVKMASDVTNNAFTILGLANGQSVSGKDVAGTINGEEATGAGQILTGKAGNDSTAGLKLQVTLTSSELSTNGTATIKVLKGVATKAWDLATSLTQTVDGVIARRTKALQSQIDDLGDQVTSLNDQIELKRERLQERFSALETLLSDLQSQSDYLAAQLQSITSNWDTIFKNNSKN